MGRAPALIEQSELGAAAWLEVMEQSGVATAMREATWLFPAAEVVHILGFVLLVGAAVVFDLRLLGLSRGVSVAALAGHVLPWSRAGLLLAAVTGVLMFVSDASATAANPAFRLKLLLIASAGLNAWAFHRGPFRTVGAWDRGVRAPVAAHLAGALSLGLWTATITAGRLIAYV